MGPIARKPARVARGRGVRPERPRRRAPQLRVGMPRRCRRRCGGFGSGRTPRPRYLPVVRSEKSAVKTGSPARAGDSAETIRRRPPNSRCEAADAPSAEDVSDEFTARAPRSNDPKQDPPRTARLRVGLPSAAPPDVRERRNQRARGVERSRSSRDGAACLASSRAIAGLRCSEERAPDVVCPGEVRRRASAAHDFEARRARPRSSCRSCSWPAA